MIIDKAVKKRRVGTVKNIATLGQAFMLHTACGIKNYQLGGIHNQSKMSATAAADI
tara:strand:- start:183 stop:350 length:168 start_codon:yes stop_codon:yes gene_type:complete